MPTLAELDDPREWVTKPGVPVLDEHESEDDERKLRVRVDERVLREIAANNNRRVAETGDPAPLVVGHTSDDPRAPEKPVVGYAVNFRVLPFGRTGRKAIYVDYKVRREHANVIADYPRRSVELWWRRKELDPIALLGGTTPERDLGVSLKFARDGEIVVRYQMTDDDPEDTDMGGDCKTKYEADGKSEKDDKKDDKPKAEPKADAKPAGGSGDDEFGAKLRESSVIKELQAGQAEIKDLLAELSEMLQGGPGAGPDGGAGPDAGTGEHDLFPDEAGDAGGADAGPAAPPAGKSKDDRKDHEAGPVRFGEDDKTDYSAAGFSGPGGTSIPGFGGKKKMSRDDEGEEVVRLRRKSESLEKTVKDLVLRNARAEAKDIIRGLKDEDVLFADEAKEEGLLVDLIVDGDATARDYHVNEVIRKNYRRREKDPAAKPADVARYGRLPDPPGGDGAKDMDESQAIAGVMRSQNLPYADALKYHRRKAAGAV